MYCYNWSSFKTLFAYIVAEMLYILQINSFSHFLSKLTGMYFFLFQKKFLKYVTTR